MSCQSIASELDTPWEVAPHPKFAEQRACNVNPDGHDIEGRLAS